MSATNWAVKEVARWLAEARRTVVLTGAGISVASGLRPYRGEGGLWTEDPSLADEMHAGVPIDRIWAAFGPSRAALVAAEPNAAHLALTKLQAAAIARGAELIILTQNIDALHVRAGSQNVVELHGRLCRTRCDACDAPALVDEVPHTSAPRCPRCGSAMRPDIVLFDEPLGAFEEVSAKRAFRDCDLFIAVGTSGTVWPAASFVRWAMFEGARTVLLNLEGVGDEAQWSRTLEGRAEEILPALVV